MEAEMKRQTGLFFVLIIGVIMSSCVTVKYNDSENDGDSIIIGQIKGNLLKTLSDISIKPFRNTQSNFNEYLTVDVCKDGYFYIKNIKPGKYVIVNIQLKDKGIGMSKTSVVLDMTAGKDSSKAFDVGRDEVIYIGSYDISSIGIPFTNAGIASIKNSGNSKANTINNILPYIKSEKWSTRLKKELEKN
jgi:hypothetical protein